ncbi:hypothetical protein [Nostoc sp.]|uniref:hypothetical protein n=1 Tax=Nostoc sp. TaxID=1180 RepID=UPI002FF527DC
MGLNPPFEDSIFSYKCIFKQKWYETSGRSLSISSCFYLLPINGVVKYTNIRYIPVSNNWYKYLWEWEEVGKVLRQLQVSWVRWVKPLP